MADPRLLRHVACPFCGLLCDDLELQSNGTNLEIGANACQRSRRAYTRVGGATSGERSPRVAGRPAPLSAAAEAAASILREAKLPLFAGLAVDVAGARAIVDLAESCGATLDHLNSPAKLRNLSTMQTHGWVTTTLTEARNRADHFLFVGGDPASRFPRLLERVVRPQQRLFDESAAPRKVEYLGEVTEVAFAAAPEAGAPLRTVCRNSDLPEVLSALRALARGRSLAVTEVAGVAVAVLAGLLERLRNAAYPVVAWAAADFAFPHGELAVETLTGLVADLNRAGRAAALPLGGSDGDFTLNAVLLWQTGFPFRVSLARGQAHYNPRRFAADALLESGEADALAWISSINDERAPPRSGVPTVVIAPPSLELEREPQVYIPVATPGVHHSGHMLRADKVVALPLPNALPSKLPSVAAVAHAIRAAL